MLLTAHRAAIAAATTGQRQLRALAITAPEPVRAQLNRALHNIALSRLRYDQPTRAYAERRRSEGKTDRDIKRATSPASSTDSSKHHPQRLDEP
jgi:hypothetical protein